MSIQTEFTIIEKIISIVHVVLEIIRTGSLSSLSYSQRKKLELILIHSEVDEPYSMQYGFQDPATTFFEKLIDFHHDMLFLMIVVLVFVFYMLMACVFNFNQWASSVPAPDVRYNAKIETIWTVVPTLILMMVVVPAFSLIYSMDDNSSQPFFSVKIAGNQWYWTYEYVFLKAKTPSLPDLGFPYIIPSAKTGDYMFFYPQRWTLTSSADYHQKMNFSTFEVHRHMVENSLKTLSTAEEWFNFHKTYYLFYRTFDVHPSGSNVSSHIKMDRSQYDFGFYLLNKFGSKSSASSFLTTFNDWISYTSNPLLNRNWGLLGVLVPFSPLSNDSLQSVEAAPNNYLKAVSYDSTMLGENEVYASAGTKARLLSVDKPLYLPLNTLLTVSVTAYDVIHSWTVPSFGVKLDGCPGRANTVSFAVKRPGIYYGQCSEICGVNHAFMPIEVRVYPIEEFLLTISKWK